MIEKRVQYATEPPEVEFFELPGGLADVWIARNVEKVEDVADNGPDPAGTPCRASTTRQTSPICGPP